MPELTAEADKARMASLSKALLEVRDLLKEANKALTLRVSVVGRAVSNGWEVADIFESLEMGFSENPNVEKARKLAAEKRKNSGKEFNPKRARRDLGINVM